MSDQKISQQKADTQATTDNIPTSASSHVVSDHKTANTTMQANIQPAMASQPNEEKIKKTDLVLINDLNAAMQVETHKGIFSVIILFAAFLIVFVVWAYFSPLEEVTRGQGSVIPKSREQIVQSLDPGIIQEMKVREGDIVEKGQILLVLDDTRSSAILRESEAKVQNLRGVVARLQAESSGTDLVFPDDIPLEVKEREEAAYNARYKAMIDAVEGFTRSKSLLDNEIAITTPMVKRGVVAQVELLRMQRQSSELAQQIAERRNRYIADANNELVQAESELAQARENMAMRADPVERSQIRAPLRGIVKNIRINTVGGVVQAGQDILEIVPLDDTLLVQAYISPKDVAFIRPGQPALVKISAYDYSLYGGLDGKVILISPDTLQDERRRSELNLNADQAYYRILVETDGNNITDKLGNKLDITPGMTATVDIKTGEKTVFQYLIKPITRMKQALQER
ncbi:HlyD family type I secretion periplasmic adaptor subunit [Pelistega ratti]|nr:HlyD family type I secretion periplasmic adaptor subunit [Pelistega ratti]